MYPQRGVMAKEWGLGMLPWLILLLTSAEAWELSQEENTSINKLLVLTDSELWEHIVGGF